MKTIHDRVPPPLALTPATNDGKIFFPSRCTKPNENDQRPAPGRQVQVRGVVHFSHKLRINPLGPTEIETRRFLDMFWTRKTPSTCSSVCVPVVAVGDSECLEACSVDRRENLISRTWLLIVTLLTDHWSIFWILGWVCALDLGVVVGG